MHQWLLPLKCIYTMRLTISIYLARTQFESLRKSIYSIIVVSITVYRCFNQGLSLFQSRAHHKHILIFPLFMRIGQIFLSFFSLHVEYIIYNNIYDIMSVKIINTAMRFRFCCCFKFYFYLWTILYYFHNEQLYVEWYPTKKFCRNEHSRRHTISALLNSVIRQIEPNSHFSW